MQENLVINGLPVNDFLVVRNATKEMCPLLQYRTEVEDLMADCIESNESSCLEPQTMHILLDSIVNETCQWVRLYASIV